MSRFVLTVLMVGLLLGAGAMSSGQDTKERIPVFTDDPTKGPEFRNKVNREKLLEALREHKNITVHFIVPAGEWYSLPIVKAWEERGDAGVRNSLESGTAGIEQGGLGVRGLGEGNARSVWMFVNGQDAIKPFTITIDYTFTKRESPERKK